MISNHTLDYILRVILPMAVIAGAIGFAVTFLSANPRARGIGYRPEQPIPFSHALHAGKMKIDCEYCHSGVAQTRHASVPSVDTCMGCHRVAKADQPSIRLLTEYFNQNIPIPWKRIHRMGDFVYFAHNVHISAGIACQECHGDVESMEVVGQSKALTMGACLDCHRQVHERLPQLKNVALGPENCGACHR